MSRSLSSLQAIFLGAAVLCGVAFGGTQFLVSNFVGPQLTDILSSLAAIGALVLGELCADLERAGEAADIATLTEKLPLFDKEMTAVDSYLRSL